jgi:hypothetical protein
MEKNPGTERNIKKYKKIENRKKAPETLENGERSSTKYWTMEEEPRMRNKHLIMEEETKAKYLKMEEEPLPHQRRNGGKPLQKRKMRFYKN